VVSSHFVLRTDLDPQTARDDSAKLEEMFAALSELGFASADQPKGRVEVVHFRSKDDYQSVTSKLSAGRFLASGIHDFERRPVALLGGDFVRATRETMLHELSHVFVHYYYPQAPPWLDEGLARYFETLTVEGEIATMGRPPRYQRFWKGSWQTEPGLPGEDTLLIPVSEAPSSLALRTMTPREFYGDLSVDPSNSRGRRAMDALSVHYQAAWCLVHLLLTDNRYSDRFGEYLGRIRAGDPDAVAWSNTLGQLDGNTLERDYAASLVPNESIILRSKIQRGRAEPTTVRTLTVAEVHVLFARVRPWDRPEDRQAAATDLVEARKSAPDDPELALVEAYAAVHDKRWADGEAALRQAIERLPRDARLWNALGWLVMWKGMKDSPYWPDGPEIGALGGIAKQLEPLAQSAAELDLLARSYHFTWQVDAAFEHEKRAIAVDSNCVECRAEVAELLLERNRYRDALDVATVALGIAGEGARPPRLIALTDTLQNLLATGGTTATDNACRSAPPFVSPPAGPDTAPVAIRATIAAVEPELFHIASVCMLLDGARVLSAHGNTAAPGATLTWRGRVPRGSERTLTFVSTILGSGTAFGFQFDLRSKHSLSAIGSEGLGVTATLCEPEGDPSRRIETRLSVQWDDALGAPEGPRSEPNKASSSRK
jgi:hypothetical protein